ncbi:hypothetical protein [Streptomyces tanashiensis]|uniref:hypothetical protein n=1 Tax=Streptomyces tanashiensis TaxID=67367 RepID=UPI0033FE3226
MDTGGEWALASRWDVVGGIVRLVFSLVFHDLPEWVRYPLLAFVCAVVVHLGLGWLRERFGGPADEDEVVHESEADVR